MIVKLENCRRASATMQRREEDGWSKVLEEGGRKGPNTEVEGLASDMRRDSLFTEIGGKEERMGPDR